MVLVPVLGGPATTRLLITLKGFFSLIACISFLKFNVGERFELHARALIDFNKLIQCWDRVIVLKIFKQRRGKYCLEFPQIFTNKLEEEIQFLR